MMASYEFLASFSQRDIPVEDRYPVCDCCQLEVGYVMDNGFCPICDDELNGVAS